MNPVAISILSGIITAFVGGMLVFFGQLLCNRIAAKKRAQDNEENATNKGVQALLMDKLEEKHDIYVKRGYATQREKELYDKVYQAYHNLGKNGVMTAAYKEVMSLPFFKEIKHTKKESK